MENEVKWGKLTAMEEETLAKLTDQGVEVFAAPIEIENAEQLHAFGLTWEQCRTWHIGNTKVHVHLTPANHETHARLLAYLRTKHSKDSRKRRCRVPGKQKPLIRCPECYKCTNCPYPEYRDKQQATELSWDKVIEPGYEDVELRNVDTRLTLEAVCKVIDAQNPLFTKAIVLKEYYGLSVDEIAKRLNTTSRNVYFYIGEAKRIGRQWKNECDL